MDGKTATDTFNEMRDAVKRASKASGIPRRELVIEACVDAFNDVEEHYEGRRPTTPSCAWPDEPPRVLGVLVKQVKHPVGYWRIVADGMPDITSPRDGIVNEMLRITQRHGGDYKNKRGLAWIMRRAAFDELVAAMRQRARDTGCSDSAIDTDEWRARPMFDGIPIRVVDDGERGDVKRLRLELQCDHAALDRIRRFVDKQRRGEGGHVEVVPAEPVWPDRWDSEALEARREEMRSDPHAFASCFIQDPLPEPTWLQREIFRALHHGPRVVQLGRQAGRTQDVVDYLVALVMSGGDVDGLRIVTESDRQAKRIMEGVRRRLPMVDTGITIATPETAKTRAGIQPHYLSDDISIATEPPRIKKTIG